MVIRWCSVALSFNAFYCDSAGSNFSAWRGEQHLQHSLLGTTMPCQQVHTPVEQLQPFERVTLYACGKLDCCTCWAQCIGGVLLLSAVICGTFTHPWTEVLDGYILQTHIKIDLLCEQWWPPEQHPGRKSRLI